MIIYSTSNNRMVIRNGHHKAELIRLAPYVWQIFIDGQDHVIIESQIAAKLAFRYAFSEVRGF